MTSDKTDKFYVCSMCGSKYGDKSALKTHTKECEVCISRRLCNLEDFTSNLTMVTTTIASQVGVLASKLGCDLEMINDSKDLPVTDVDEDQAAPVKPPMPSIQEEREICFCCKTDSKGKQDLYRWSTLTKKYEKMSQEGLKHVFTSLVKKEYTMM